MNGKKPIFVIGELGINHNGSVDSALQLIDAAIFSGCDAIKLQKRDLDTVYTKEQLDKPRESPWGTTTREQKEGLEFGKEEYDIINDYCAEKEIPWFASAWDTKSQLFLRQYDTPYNKIASAMLTHEPLLEMVAREKKMCFVSTGMATMAEIGHAVSIFREWECPFTLMHCVSTYPMDDCDANLNMIETLKKEFGCPIGYSSHSSGILLPTLSVVMGAVCVEVHITLDRTDYGSDQAASIELPGLWKLVKYVRATEIAMGNGKKEVSETEEKIKKKLRYFE